MSQERIPESAIDQQKRNKDMDPVVAAALLNLHKRERAIRQNFETPGVPVNPEFLDPAISMERARKLFEEQVQHIKPEQVNARHYGLTVVENLGKVLLPERLEPLKKRLKTYRSEKLPDGIDPPKNASGDLDKDQQELLGAIFKNGLAIPNVGKGSYDTLVKSLQEHRYLYADDNARTMLNRTTPFQFSIPRINSREVQKDINRLNNLLPATADPRLRAIMQETVGILEQLILVDPANIALAQRIQPSTEKTDPKLMNAAGSIRLIGGMIFLGLGLLSAVVERNKFPWLTIIYGGIGMALLNPGLFDGKNERIKKQLAFAQDPKTGTMNSVVENLGFTHEHWWDSLMGHPTLASRITPQLMNALTKEKVQILSKEYVSANDPSEENLIKKLPIDDQQKVSLKALVDEDRRNNREPRAGYFGFLIAHTALVTEPEAKYLLQQFAREKTNIRSVQTMVAQSQQPAQPQQQPKGQNLGLQPGQV